MFHLLSQLFFSFNRRERQLFWGAALVFLLSGFFVSLNAYYSATEEQPAAGGRYLEGVVGQPTYINPLLAQNNEADFDLIEILYSDLLDLTDKHEISNDQKVWLIFLKPDRQWSDGKKLTADDVIFTIEALQDPDNRSPLTASWQGVVAEKLNENELRLTLKKPHAFFRENLALLKVVPQHIFGGIPVANLRLSSYNLEPVGSGPYRFNSLTAEKDGFISQISLVPNQFYKGEGPFLQEVIFKFYRNDQDLIKDFNLKKISGFGGLNPENIKDIKINHQLLTLNLPRYYAVFFNQNLSPALKDKNLRQALAQAVDKKKLIKEVFNGQAALADGPIPPPLPGYDKSVYENLPPATNHQLPTTPLELQLVVPDLAFLIKTANLIKGAWQKIGVELTLNVIDINNINRNIIKTREYPLLLFGNILKNNPDVFAFWHSSEKFHPGLNLALFENKTADALLEKIREEFDQGKRQQLLTQLQKIIAEEAPAIFLYNPNYLYVAPPDLQGLGSPFIATPSHRFENIAQWHIKTKRVIDN